MACAAGHPSFVLQTWTKSPSLLHFLIRERRIDRLGF